MYIYNHIHNIFIRYGSNVRCPFLFLSFSFSFPFLFFFISFLPCLFLSFSFHFKHVCPSKNRECRSCFHLTCPTKRYKQLGTSNASERSSG